MINKCENTNNNSNEYDYTWLAGDSEEIAIRLKDTDDQVINIESGKVQLRINHISNTVVLDKSGIYDTENGVFSVSFTAEETQSIISNNQSCVVFKYDLELVLANGETFTPIFGNINVKQSITR